MNPALLPTRILLSLVLFLLFGGRLFRFILYRFYINEYFFKLGIVGLFRLGRNDPELEIGLLTNELFEQCLLLFFQADELVPFFAFEFCDVKGVFSKTDYPCNGNGLLFCFRRFRFLLFFFCDLLFIFLFRFFGD